MQCVIHPVCASLRGERARGGGAAPDWQRLSTPRGAPPAGEEGSAAQGCTDELTGAPTWMVDPLDGTTNFIHRQPNVCVSIGLVVEKQVRRWARAEPALDGAE